MLFILILGGQSTEFSALRSKYFCCFVAAVYRFKQKVFLTVCVILISILVIEHLKYSSTLCVATILIF